MASELLTEAPSANTVRSYVKTMLASRLPKSLLKSKLPGAIDLTEIPYHGEHEADDDANPPVNAPYVLLAELFQPADAYRNSCRTTRRQQAAYQLALSE